MNVKSYIDSLLEYYEYLVQYDKSASMLSIGVRIQEFYNNYEKREEDDDYWANCGKSYEYDLETEFDIIKIEKGLSLLTYKQFTRDKALNQLV